MQLPPRSSSSYTVIPEKSFHLCQTCTLSSSCARTHKRGAVLATRVNAHSHLNALTRWRLFLIFCPPPSSLLALSVPPLSALHGNTTPSHSVQICSSIQLTVQSLSVSVRTGSSSPHSLTTVAPPQSRTFIQDNCAKKTGGIWILLPSCASQALVNGGWLGAE